MKMRIFIVHSVSIVSDVDEVNMINSEFEEMIELSEPLGKFWEVKKGKDVLFYRSIQ